MNDFRKGKVHNMQMYEVTVLSEDMKTVLQKEVICAENEDDAIDRIQGNLQQNAGQCGMCMASEI